MLISLKDVLKRNQKLKGLLKVNLLIKYFLTPDTKDLWNKVAVTRALLMAYGNMFNIQTFKSVIPELI